MTMMRLAECMSAVLPRAHDWQTRLAREWPNVVGTLSERMRLEQVKGTMLVIGVYDSHWISELFLLTPRIIEEINKFLGSNQVTHLRFVIAKRTSSHKKTEFFENSEQKPRARMSPRQEKVLSSIKDRQLHDALEKFFYASVS